MTSMLSDEARGLRPGQFRAFCAKGHDRVDFDDRAAFEDHARIDHGARELLPGGASHFNDGRTAPGWARGGIQDPYAWESPRRTPGGLAKVVERIERGDYDMPLTYTGPTVRLGEAVA